MYLRPVSIRNPFPRAKKAANIDTSPAANVAPKPSAGKLLSRPSNRIVSHSTSEASTTSRGVASSALASLTRFHPLSVGSNQSSSASSSNSTSTYYSHGNSDSYPRSVSCKDREDDSVDGLRSTVPGGAISNNSSNNSSSLPVLSASNGGQGANSSNITVSSASSGSSSVSSSYHQRLQIAGVTRENSSSSVLPGPALSVSGSDSIVNKSNPKGLVGLQNLGNTW